MARLSDADQGRLPVARLDSRGADRARPGAVLRPGPAGPAGRHPGVAVVLLEEPSHRSRALPGARPVHPTDEVEEHPALAQGRRADHPPRHRVLREGVSVAQLVVTPLGLGAIVWVLWYFLLSSGPSVRAAAAGAVPEIRATPYGGYTPAPMPG